MELCPTHIREKMVVEAYKDIVGLSRQQVATTLMQ